MTGCKTEESRSGRDAEDQNRPATTLLVPRGLTAEVFEVGGMQIVVLEHLSQLVMPECLTPSEAAVAQRIADGLSTQALAKERGVSPRTVRNQLASIYDKVGVNTREELVAKLLE